MTITSLRRWLWENRKGIITAGIAYLFLQLVFYQSGQLWTWALAHMATLAIGVWWIAGPSVAMRRVWLMVAEVWWLAAAGLGFIVFSLVATWQFQITAALMLVAVFWLLVAYRQYAEEGDWQIKTLPILDFLNLLAFFFFGASTLLAADFYSLNIGWLAMAFVGQVVLAMYLRFWREEIGGMRRWLYLILTAVVTQEILWVVSYWHRGVYLKAFLLAVIFYLLADFTISYLKGMLTVRMVMEYVVLALAVVIGVLIIDGLVVLR